MVVDDDIIGYDDGDENDENHQQHHYLETRNRLPGKQQLQWFPYYQPKVFFVVKQKPICG